MDMSTLYAVLGGIAVVLSIGAAAPTLLRRLLIPEPDRRAEDQPAMRENSQPT